MINISPLGGEKIQKNEIITKSESEALIETFSSNVIPRCDGRSTEYGVPGSNACLYWIVIWAMSRDLSKSCLLMEYLRCVINDVEYKAKRPNKFKTSD